MSEVIDAINATTAVIRSNSEDDGIPNPREFLDLVVFYKCLDVIGKVTGDKKIDVEGRRLAIAYQGRLLELSEHFVEPILAIRGFGALRTVWNRLKQPAKKTDVVQRKRGALIAAAYGKARKIKGQTLRNLFSGPDHMAAKRLGGVGMAAKGMPAEELEALAEIHILGGMTRTKKYVRAALRSHGIEQSEFQEAMAEVAEAKELGSKIRAVETQRLNADPADTERQYDLAIESKDLQNEVAELADNSVAPASITDAAVREAAKSAESTHATTIGAELGLSPAQEDAMMVRGKAVIAAGAGAGKTATLSGKVVYHIKELGASPHQIIATSFSRKSAYELLERINKAGGGNIIPTSALDGYGTTHSVAGKLLGRFANKGYGEGDNAVLTSGQQSSMIKMAMKQVEMPSRGKSRPAPRGLFADAVTKLKGIEAGIEEPIPVEVESDPTNELSWFDALQRVITYNENPDNRKRNSFWKVHSGVASSIIHRGLMPHSISDKQKYVVKRAFEAAGISTIMSPAGGFALTAGAVVLHGPGTVVQAAGSQYWKTPANQWFNLGKANAWIDASGSGPPKKIGHKAVGLAIGLWKANLVSPSEAARDEPGAFSAAYAAYEWLKANDPAAFAPRDQDDILIQASEVLISNPSALSTMKSEKSTLLIDECLPYKTPVMLADGSSMEIGKIVEEKIPVSVLAYNTETGEQEECKVTAWQKILNQKPLVKVKATYRKETAKSINVARNFVVCTEDHKIFVKDVGWVEAGQLKPGMIVQVETAAEKSQAYKITAKGRDSLSREMTTKNTLGRMVTRGAGPGVFRGERGGNGKGMTVPQRVLFDALGDGWQAELAIPTKKKRGSGYPFHYKIDLAHMGSKTAVEVDGASHGMVERRQQDRKKEDLLSSMGWTVLRIPNVEAVQNTASVVANINSYVKQEPTSCGTDNGCPIDAVISSVEPTRIPDYYVYDITVADCHNFYANGILVHNCQDQNKAQHLLFGLISGYYNPETQQPNEDGSMTADTYCLIGDDKQCLSVDSLISVPSGTKALSALSTGGSVLSYRNGDIAKQTVKHIIPSQWTWGYRVTTESTASVLMSPVHKLWASHPGVLDSTEVFVYLMYRKDLGFRVGITGKGGYNRGGDYTRSFAYRAVMEKAEKLWLLDKCADREDALLKEYSYSLEYSVPTCVFQGTNRGLNQSRINKVFGLFGKNGLRLLKSKNLSFDLPHWHTQSYTKHGNNKRVINLIAHARYGSQVSFEWSDERMSTIVDRGGLSLSAKGCVYSITNDGSRRIRRYFANYREALSFAKELSRVTGASLSQRLSSPFGTLRYITASGIFVGMSLPVLNDEGKLIMDPVISVERESGKFLDIDVDDASNLFANNVLVSNSIYSFRGADPDIFIDMSTKQGFETKMLDTNYRSGSAIINAANNLIEKNKKQIKMVCRSNPSRGVGNISMQQVMTHLAGAELVATEIEELVKDEESGSGPSDFGVACRTNAEMHAYCMELSVRGVPFRCPKIKLFNDKTSKALINWMGLAVLNDSDTVKINKIVLEAFRAPSFSLDKRFGDHLQQQAAGQNYLEYLDNGGWSAVYSGNQAWRNKRSVLPYTKALRKMKDFTGSPSEALQEVLNLEGSFDPELKTAGSILEALVAAARKDSDIMDLLTEEAVDGVVTDEAVREAAIAPVAPLMAMLERYEDLNMAMDFVWTLQEANKTTQKKGTPDSAKSKDPGYDVPAVVIDTVHGWKGLEAPHMYVPMPKNIFPHRMSTDEDEMASERRLAYVAITRGRDSVKIICPQEAHNGMDAGVSRFVAEACIPHESQILEPELQISSKFWDELKDELENEHNELELKSAGAFGRLMATTQGSTNDD